MTPQQFVALINGLAYGCDAQVVLAQLGVEHDEVERLKETIRALEAGATNIAIQARILGDEITKQVQTGEHRDRREGQCQHPENERIPMGVMGHPSRFQCNVCKEFVD